jgi:hypothetical protein
MIELYNNYQLKKLDVLVSVLLKYPAGKGTEPASGSRKIELLANKKLKVINRNIV